MMQSQSPIASGASPLSNYDHVRFLTRSRVAWEYLRRNPDYRRDWRMAAPGRPRLIRLTDDTNLLRARRFVHAEAWGLYTFRRSRG